MVAKEVVYEGMRKNAQEQINKLSKDFSRWLFKDQIKYCKHFLKLTIDKVDFIEHRSLIPWDFKINKPEGWSFQMLRESGKNIVFIKR